MEYLSNAESRLNSWKALVLDHYVNHIVYICENDPSYSIVWINDKFKRLLGWEPDEFTTQRRRLSDLYHPDDYLERIKKPVDKAIRNNEEFHLVYRIKSNITDEWVWVRERGRAETADGGIIFLYGAIWLDAGLAVVDDIIPPVPGQHVEMQIRAAAQSILPVLVVGEFGTGKSSVAKMIHENSERGRHGGELIRVRCNRLQSDPEELLLGMRSHTTRQSQSSGLFSQAEGGTVVLDDVGDLPHDLQQVLADFIETGALHLQEDNSSFASDVRLILTVRPEKLNTIVQELRYATGVIRIDLLTLRNHPSSISKLASDFLISLAHVNGAHARFRPPNVEAIPKWTEEHSSLAIRYGWPGNVRELYNVLLQSLAAGSKDQTLALSSVLSPLLPREE